MVNVLNFDSSSEIRLFGLVFEEQFCTPLTLPYTLMIELPKTHLSSHFALFL